ncbi:MAG: hypothetical protein QOG28_6485, partial [Trebonia sp.]|nr:hypothetical protein [Trebonia sp.]
YHKLARGNPGGYAPALITALTNLSIAYVGVGRPSDAIRPARENIDICRWLAAASPARYGPALASGLDNLAICLDCEATNLALRGRKGKAQKLWREAIKIRADIGAS